MNLKQKISGAIATGAAFAILAPAAAFASINVNVDDNGAFSKNGVAVISASKSVVKQTNNSKITNVISSVSNTGGNSIKYGVGGANSITTGGTTTLATIEVEGSSNTKTSDCGCPEGDIDVDVTNNGAFSTNGVLVVDLNKNVVKQSNRSRIANVISSVSNTGNNSVKFTVGGGNTIGTGSTDTAIGAFVGGASNNN